MSHPQQHWDSLDVRNATRSVEPAKRIRFWWAFLAVKKTSTIAIAASAVGLAAVGAVACGTGHPAAASHPTADTQPKAASQPPSHSAANDAGMRTNFTDGVWQVGLDIPAGTYKTGGVNRSGLSDFCTWQRAVGQAARDGDFEGQPLHTISNPAKITLFKGDAFYTTGGCRWKLS